MAAWWNPERASAGGKWRERALHPASPRQPRFKARIAAQWPTLPFYFQKYVSLDDKFCGHPKNAEEYLTTCRFCGLKALYIHPMSLRFIVLYVFVLIYIASPRLLAVILTLSLVPETLTYSRYLIVVEWLNPRHPQLNGLEHNWWDGI